MQKFSELVYERPDIPAVVKQYEAYNAAFAAAKTFEEAKAVFEQVEALETHLYTAASLCNIRNTMDTTDEYYDAEMAYINENMPNLIPASKVFNEAIVNGPFRAEFEAEYGVHFIKIMENNLRIQDARIIEDLVKESELSVEYSKIAASCQAEFRGETCNFYGLLKHMESTDRAERKEAFEKWAELYAGVADKLDEVYDKLIEVRLSMAEKLGFENYTQLAYLNMGRLDYTPEHVAKFREQVRTVITPAVARMREKQAERLGLEKIRYYDESLVFPYGNADPMGKKDDMVQAAAEMYAALSAETKEFFEFMTKYELFDLETRPGKHLGGYCTSLPDFKAPFIFSNFNGTSADVDVLTHEAGHAFQCFLGERLIPVSTLQGSTSEINEIHSMAMEFFTYPWMEKFFGDRADEYRYAHLCDALAVVPYMVTVDEYQHEVYKNPKMTAMERRAVWSDLEKKYMPWRDYDGNEFLENGGFWMQKQHIFLYPFYYIDYALAQICTFSLYSEMKTDRSAAWSRYLNLCRAGGTKGYFDLLHDAGIPVPFEEGAVESAVRGVIEEIENAGY
ncbi:MAG: M3 family oligoendopeptidase [Clostridia bacterium]|nr:M3 family oligoendopeptidase [Clostridia bacterium]